MTTLNAILKSTIPLYENRAAIHYKSPPGVGKSDTVKQQHELLEKTYGEEFGLTTVYLTSYDAPDIRGFAVPHKNPDGSAVTVFTKSPILTAIEATGLQRGILYLDERDQSDAIVQKAIAPTVYDRTIGDGKLPDGWWVISSSNRMSDRAGVVRPPMHLINREVILDIDFDVDGWAAWATNHGVHPMMVAFGRSRPGQLSVDELPRDPVQFCSPRSATRAGHYLAQIAGVNADGDPNMHLPDDDTTQQIIQGYVGKAAAAEMFGFFKVANELPDKNEILNSPQTAKLPDRMDAQYAAMQMCIHHADADTVNPLFEYITRLSLELQTSAAKTLIEKSEGVLLNSEALTKFIRENRALVINTMS